MQDIIEREDLLRRVSALEAQLRPIDGEVHAEGVFDRIDPGRIARDIQHQVEGPLRQVGRTLEQGLRAVQHDAERGVRAVGDGVKHELPHLAEQAVKSALAEGGEAIAKEALSLSAKGARALYGKLHALRESRADLYDAIDEVGFQVSISVVTFSYARFMGRAAGLCDLLDRIARDQVLKRSTVKYLLLNSGPEELHIHISGQLFTTAISAGIGISVPFALGVELVDMALAELGVPA